jgi:hypothetical protein
MAAIPVSWKPQIREDWVITQAIRSACQFYIAYTIADAPGFGTESERMVPTDRQGLRIGGPGAGGAALVEDLEV